MGLDIDGWIELRPSPVTEPPRWIGAVVVNAVVRTRNCELWSSLFGDPTGDHLFAPVRATAVLPDPDDTLRHPKGMCPSHGVSDAPACFSSPRTLLQDLHRPHGDG